MKHFQKTHAFLVTVMALCMLVSLSAPASAFDAAKPSQNIIAAGFDHAGMVDENGTLWMWGGNDFGQLGNGGTASSNVPVKIMDDVVSVGASGYGQGNMTRTITTAAIRSDGSLWTWGVADSKTILNILGTGSNGNAVTEEIETISGPAQIAIQNEPVKILDNVASISLGGWCALAVKKDGSLWAWGNMGYDSNSFNSNVPVKVMDGVSSACAGPQCAAAIKTDGSLWIWGYDMMADEEIEGVWQLSKTPAKVMDNVSEVSIGCTADSGGFTYVSAVKTDGSLWLWGTDWGTLGLPEQESGFNETPIKMMDGVTHVSAGCGHIAVLKNDSSLWAWGDNALGELGNGTQESSVKPIKVMEDVTAVSAGDSFTLAVKKDGSVWSWGTNDSGELGNGGKGNAKTDYGSVYQTTPTQIPNLKAKAAQNSQPTQPNTPVQTLSFTDVQPNAYYYDAVNWAVEHGITSGTSASTFSPNDTCTRAQIITFLWRASGSPEPAGTVAVSDVKSSDYYYKAVLWAAENGIVSGKIFLPDSPCTRAMAVEFIWKQAGSPSSTRSAGFTDVASGASYEEAVSWALDKGITSGTSDTTFSPDATCTRAQIVTFLYRDMA